MRVAAAEREPLINSTAVVAGRKPTVRLLAAAVLLLGSIAATLVLIKPLFGYYIPDTLGGDFINHVALVAGALDTWRTTHAPPLSSDQLVPGIEYPYYLFGNAGLYVLASFVSFALNQPAAFGVACTLIAGLVLGQLGTYLLARSFGLNPVYAAVLGFLYATGPYMSVNLLVRVDFPEFLIWQVLPLVVFVARRAMQPRAHWSLVILLCLGMVLLLYLHKLVGPQTILFTFALILVNARLAIDWWLKLVFLGVSVPALTVFAWLPILGLPREQIVTLAAGSLNPVQVFSSSLVNYLWPWAQNSLPPQFDEPVYYHRFAIQLGVLATAGFAFGCWCLMISRLRPRNRELFVGLVGCAFYSSLVLGIGGLVQALPFPLNTIQFSYRLLGLATFAGVLALIISLADVTPAHVSKVGYCVAAITAGATLVSIATYWGPPHLTTVVQAEIQPLSLLDISAFYSKSSKSMLDTSGAIAADGKLGMRVFPIGLRAPVEHVPPGGTSLLPADSRDLPRTLFVVGHSTAPAVLHAFALKSSVDQPCASDTEVSRDQPDLLSVLLASCASRGQDPKKVPIVLDGSPRVVTLLQKQALDGTNAVNLRLPIPDETSFVALECDGLAGASPTANPPPSCLTLEYLGPANQPDGTVQVPRPIPADALSRGPFGHWSIDLSNQPAGDYLLPTYDYPFVLVSRPDGSLTPAYQFDRRPVIRFDGRTPRFAVDYDLSLEARVLAGWAALMLACSGVFLVYRVYRARRQ